ncbi:MAG TPA: CPBP family intramembrane glutamic endopeptidase, partial [Solirubrobacterales bacterium]|nr:CPBP family intramembrane glutamic endopeptidase [Solirubrobacterales bacterium]
SGVSAESLQVSSSLAGAAVRPRIARPLLIGTAAIAMEWTRGLAEREPTWTPAALLLGGLALCALGLTVPFDRLGLGLRGLGWRFGAGLAIGAVLLLPALVRRAPLPGLPPALFVPAALVAAGEEIAFRGALFAALDEAFGPAVAIAGSSAAFVLAHVLTHPPEFLLPVAALGVLLGLWRWACRDLVAPIVAHVFADLAL